MHKKKIFRKDYQAPSHQVLSLELWFDIYDDFTIVQQSSKLKQNAFQNDLFLDGKDLDCLEVRVNDSLLLNTTNENLEMGTEGMLLKNLPLEFNLSIKTKIYTNRNTDLEGLYRSGGILCTQCEAHGFRRITYFQDRPDVLTKYTVHITADKAKYPVLLSNGNFVGTKIVGGGRHSVTWYDPFNKPSYLFALVAGDIGALRDEFITKSGRTVKLEIYSAHGKQKRCDHAMVSLKKAMLWDEQRFGREYDLNTYMILVVDDFNMGAMENKGLNIFNSRAVFANEKTSTDQDYLYIEAVIAHEYFHNWTGNRITVRDWFNLSLKEGLTIFRDQEFSGDMSSREKVRIDTVIELRDYQFAEDAGPNSHPILPESCYAVENFYTSTIYNKGAEVIRMMQTMVGRPAFRKGMDLYFERFDGKAVTIDDFASTISEATGQDWTQFKHWYSQKGTPKIKVAESFKNGTYEIVLSQNEIPALHVPLCIALIDKNGKEIDLPVNDSISINSEGQFILNLRQLRQTWSIGGLPEKPRLSLNRQFSAPVILDWDLNSSDLEFLVEKDNDSFNRWDSAQKLLVREFCRQLNQPNCAVSNGYLSALSTVVGDNNLPTDFRSTFLKLPSDSYFLQNVEMFSSPKFLIARNLLEEQISNKLESVLAKIYLDHSETEMITNDPRVFGRRALKNGALSLLAKKDRYKDKAKHQFIAAKTMTDELAAYNIIADIPELSDEAHSTFYMKWHSEYLVLNKWFATQASSRLPATFQNVIRLCNHKDFDIKNPNRVYSLLCSFGENLVRFHDPLHDTYTFMADRIIEIDKINPLVAARISNSFDVWIKLELSAQNKLRTQLERLNRANLSRNTFEIIEKQLLGFPNG